MNSNQGAQPQPDRGPQPDGGGGEKWIAESVIQVCKGDAPTRIIDAAFAGGATSTPDGLIAIIIAAASISAATGLTPGGLLALVEMVQHYHAKLVALAQMEQRMQEVLEKAAAAAEEARG